MEVRMETLGRLELMGVPVTGDPRTVDFHVAWRLFGRVADAEGISRAGRDLFGLQIYPPGFPKDMEITYLACIEKGGRSDPPLRLVMKSLPESRYAVGRVVGGVRNIDRMIRHLYREYLPANGYVPGMPLDFEKYCRVRSPDEVPGEIEIWVPVKGV